MVFVALLAIKGCYVFFLFDFSTLYVSCCPISLGHNLEIVRKMYSCPRSEASRATEILRTIFQPRALSSDIPASRKGVYLFYNPPNNFSTPTHVDRSYIFGGFFLVSRYGIVNQPFI